ncbi:MAG: hypothetical protein ABIP20_20195 [Chthoniobacteraceae bacterium]
MSDQPLPKGRISHAPALPKKTPAEMAALVQRMREMTPKGFRMPPPSDPTADRSRFPRATEADREQGRLLQAKLQAKLSQPRANS